MSDTIYRQEAIDAMEQRYQDILRIFKRKVKVGEKAIVLDMIGCSKSLPPADRLPTATDIVKAIKDAEYRGYMKAVKERPQGEWIYHRPPDDWVMSLYSCSECGHIEEGKPNFCPNCGADMRKGADDES